MIPRTYSRTNVRDLWEYKKRLFASTNTHSHNPTAISGRHLSIHLFRGQSTKRLPTHSSTYTLLEFLSLSILSIPFHQPLFLFHIIRALGNSFFQTVNLLFRSRPTERLSYIHPFSNPMQHPRTLKLQILSFNQGSDDICNFPPTIYLPTTLDIICTRFLQNTPQIFEL